MNEVNLTKRVNTPEGNRYCPVVIAGNGRVKPDWVVVGGKKEHHPEGCYYLEWRENGNRVRLSVGKDATDARNKRLRKEAELAAIAQGIEVAPEKGKRTSEPTLQSAVGSFLMETRLTKKPKTYAAYKTATAYFLESCHKMHLSDVDRHDMLKFIAFLREQKQQSPRSVYNKFENVMTFLKAQGIRGLVTKNDWPRFVEQEPEVYDKAEIQKLLKACDAQERLWFEFFLMTGMREQEVIHTCWRDVNFSQATITVRWKPEYGFSPKNYKEREIPIPAKLLAALKSAKENAIPGCPLVFPTKGCNPKLDFLDVLKVVAKRAGLAPEDCWLHKFRATFATWSLWAGVDLRTVQQWLGHSDMESTMRYLKPSRSESVRAKVNQIFA
jgi:integrase/recombinase XerD